MVQVAVVTDRACDLSPALQKRYGITVVPLVVRFGTEVVLDDGQLTGDEFWRRVAASPSFPETSQPSSGMFEEKFASLVEAGYHVVCPVITSKLSGTYNAAHAACGRFAGQVSLFDTLALSLAQGFQVLAAARAAQQGAEVEDVMRLLEEMRPRTHMYIALDTIEYLRRGGRAAKVMPALDRLMRALHVKPLLRLADGELAPLGAARSRAKAQERIAERIAAHGPAEMLGVTHTRCAEEAAAFASALAEALDFPRERVLVEEAGPALSAHAGPGVIAAAVVQERSAS